jgi:hypothetical protein
MFGSRPLREDDEDERKPLLSRGAPTGILTQYVISKKDDQQYISDIPEYTGSVIPTTLIKVSMGSLLESNYQDLKSFLENLGNYGRLNEWVIAGLLADTDVTVEKQKHWFFGFGSKAVKAAKSSVNVNITKQILCKRIRVNNINQIVFLINVVDSENPELNTLVSNTIMVMTLPPPPPPPTPPPPLLPSDPPIPVPASGFVSPHSRVSAHHVGVNNELTSFEVRGGIDFIKNSLSGRPIFVIDPNRVKGAVTVDWFGNGIKSLNDIDLIVYKILEYSPPPPIGTGGKSRYSKKRVTKRRKTTKHRKSTKRRHRRTTRKPT